MEALVPWEEYADFFKEKFTACQKCQGGHKNQEAMLVHLTTSHFQREALTAFGKGMTCSICAENLSLRKDSYRQYYILSHMTKHFNVLAAAEVKLMLAMAKKVETEVINESGDEDSGSSSSQGSRTDCMSEILSDGLGDQKDWSSGTSSISSGQDSFHTQDEQMANSSFELEPEGQFANPVTDHSNAKPNLKVHSQSWKDCLEYFKEKYPTCKGCQTGNTYQIRKHVTYKHYGELAIKTFGSDKRCSICNCFEVDQNDVQWKRVHLIKFHMTMHLEQFIPDERARDLLLNAEGKQHYLKIVPQRNVKVEKVAETPAVQIEAEYTLSRPGPIGPGSPWQEAQDYFRNKYPGCRTCRNGQTMPKNMRRHLTFMHCGQSAVEAFGKGNVCSVCNKFSIQAHGKPTEQIKNHMVVHLEEFIPDQRAREVLLKIRLKKYSPHRGTNSHIIAEKRARQSIHLADCKRYFQDKHPSCQGCRMNHARLPRLLRHLTIVHYGERAIEIFGKSGSCSLCNAFCATPSDTSWAMVAKIKHHMATHLQQFVPDERARDLLLRAMNLTLKK